MTTIMHVTDLVHDDRLAFTHAVALARAGRARLVAVHANAPDTAVVEIPDAADILRTWGDEPTAVDFTKRVHNCCDEPVETILDAIMTMAPDLVVAATHQHSALARFILGSDAEAIAHNVTTPVLLLSPQTRGFVTAADGTIDMHRIVIPIGDAQEAATAVAAAARLADLAGTEQVEFLLVHVGPAVDVATAALEARPGWTVWHRDVERTKVEEAIVRESAKASVVVMATRGHNSVGDVFRGSHTDRVLHGGHCPLLSVRV